MTARSDLKRHIRARLAKTGESYTAARLQVLCTRSSDSPVVSPPPAPPERETRGAAESSGSGALPDGLTENVLPERASGVVLKCNDKSIRLRLRGEEGSVTLRCSAEEARRVAPAQHVEVTVSKRWTWRGDAYASGEVARAWTDVATLNLEPLPLENQGIMDLNEVHEPFVPPDPYAEMWAFLASTPRTVYEFDDIAWGAGVGVDPNDIDAHLVADAARSIDRDPDRARELLMKAVLADPRCIDAHVHLGNLVFDHRPQDAITHYEIAVAVGELSIGTDFGGLLPWGCLYNRPLLRALKGYGLCLWRLGRTRQARDVFERLLSLNPADNQGVRYCWSDIRKGRPWTPDDVGEGYYSADTVH